MSQDASNHPVPRHIAIIMDGNGRWAQSRGLPRAEGHRRGAEVARETMLACAERGIEALTLYSFSTENWKRPADEIEALMALGTHYLTREADTLMTHNIRFRHVGHRDRLSPDILNGLDALAQRTAGNTGMTLALAMNYGARSEITAAAKRLAEKVAAGALTPDDITEQTLADHLLTAGLPDPDLLIRTAGEMRLSNFLLWQISYAELWVTETPWPEFNDEHIDQAIAIFNQRHRRFGEVPDAPAE